MKFLPLIKLGFFLSVQWPTGYGKSIGFAMVWKHCQESGIANRFLLVVANDTQRQQIVNDFAGDCSLVGAPCKGGVWAFDRSASDLRAAVKREAEVFVCTVQQLDASHRGGLNVLKDLLTAAGTSWMIGFDEYHHYGKDMSWGNAASAIMRHAAFTMAMSATPYRRGPDVIFEEPKLTVTYAKAVEEKAVKPMLCHSYEYRVTVKECNGDSNTYTTTELLEMCDGKIDQWEERRNIRYSPEYVHPLILNPLTRLAEKKAEHGQRLQMLIRAMSCRHAEMVCQQVRAFAGHLNVDWIGTGPHGRDEKKNDEVRKAFCPPKQDGVRPEPTLDVLVQVSMAGEGFDSINVAEIVDLFPVSKKAANGRATTDKQFYGRGSRIIPLAPGVILHVSVPSDHPLDAWAGGELHAWMDSSGEIVTPVAGEPKGEREPDLYWFPDLPKQREIELLSITTEDEHYVNFAKSVCERNSLYDFDRDEELLCDLYRKAHMKVAKEESRQVRLVQIRSLLEDLVGRIAYVLAKRSAGQNITGAIIGTFKKQLNGDIIQRFGKPRDEMLPEEIEAVYSWGQLYLKSLKESSR